jgi:hypothetical protein
MGGNKTCVLCGNASPISGALPITTFSAPWVKELSRQVKLMTKKHPLNMIVFETLNIVL